MTEDHNLYSLFERQFLAAGDAAALTPAEGGPGLSYRDLAAGAGRYRQCPGGRSASSLATG
jgi:hypothetical protein